ncbi:MAG: metallophosphoesterase [Candidatus Sumerlaeia bacterium]|nr:metallophosphoesterase [Candidatus Sumerlaeia bacterium]
MRIRHGTAAGCVAALSIPGGAPGAPALVSPEIEFAVIGDFGDAGQAELDVANLVKSWGPEFIVTVGDNNYVFGEAATIDQNIGQYYHEFIGNYQGGYGAGSAINRFFPALGNHDWDSGAVPLGCQPHLDYFTLPGNERYFDFVWGPVHFYVIDTDPREPDGNTGGSVQGQWLRDRLRASGDPWHVVLAHHSPYSSAVNHGSQAFAQWPHRPWGAQLVLSGHDHTYERLSVGGLPYIVNGIGGRSLYGFNAVPESGSIVRYNSNYGAQRVEANADAMRLRLFSRTPTLRDTYHLTPWRIDGEPEPNLDPVATAPGGQRLYVDRVGDWLYVAANSAQGTGHDRFVYVARAPGALQAANWAKTGQVAAWEFFLAEEESNQFHDWYSAAGVQVPASLEFESHTGTGNLLEGCFNMRSAWGSVPASVEVCTASFATASGGALDTGRQVPAPVAVNGNIEANEYLAVVLPPPATAPYSPWTIDGLLEPSAVPLATNGGQTLYAVQDGEWLYVAAEAPASGPAVNDLFIYVARAPGALRAANWAKSGQVAAWDLFLAREGASVFNNWYDAQEEQYVRVSRHHNGAVSGQVLEGAINMVQAWGSGPSSVHLAIGEFGTSDGGALDTGRQVPPPVTVDGIIQAYEFHELPLGPVPARLTVLEGR